MMATLEAKEYMLHVMPLSLWVHIHVPLSGSYFLLLELIYTALFVTLEAHFSDVWMDVAKELIQAWCYLLQSTYWGLWT